MNHPFRFAVLLVLAAIIGSYCAGVRHLPGRVTPAIAAPVQAQIPSPAPVAAQTVSTIPAATPTEAGRTLGVSAQDVADWRNYTPATLSVQLTPDLALPFRVTKVQQENGRTVLTARLDKASPEPSNLDSAFLVSTSNAADRWEAVVELPGEEYRVHVLGGLSTVEQVPTEFKCGVQEDRASDLMAALATPSVETTTAADGAAYTVDVLFTYNQGALAYHNGQTATVDADCSNFIAASNAMLANSQVTTFVWRYLGCVAAPAYPETSSLSDDLTAMRTGALGTFDASQKRAFGADQIVMIVGGDRTDGIAGIAYLGPTGNHYAAVQYPERVSVLHQDGSVTYTYQPTPPIVVAHEMGHNFGCQHDRQTVGAPDNNGLYCYGFRFADNTVQPAVPDLGTIMSYANRRILYYSNPTISYHGYALGVAAGQPKAANNALVLTNNAPALTATSPTGAMPIITQQPQSVTVSTGTSFSLSVTASGENLAYQWTMGGAAISGATLASYSVSSASSIDAASYTVIVSNVMGAVTSNAATVTVNDAPAPTPLPPSSSAGSGGGGGGGACEAWFAASVLLLFAARVRSSPNKGC